MNICSNQIKEVILHRFKVNSLQKLLIHINFLLAFSVLFCSHSAFGQSGASAVVGPTVTLVDRDYSGIPNSSYIVDLGLSDVYWADRNVGAGGWTPRPVDEYGAARHFAEPGALYPRSGGESLPAR